MFDHDDAGGQRERVLRRAELCAWSRSRRPHAPAAASRQRRGSVTRWRRGMAAWGHPARQRERWGAEKRNGPISDRPVEQRVARPAGFEPTTPWFVAKYSIQLSYGRTRREVYTSPAAGPTAAEVGGDEGIRTLDARFCAHAPLAGECLRPLGHVSRNAMRGVGPRGAKCSAPPRRGSTRAPCVPPPIRRSRSPDRRPCAGPVPRAPCTCRQPRPRS
jgi:hypothetical protein